MPGPKFVQRVARIPALLAAISTYPEGLSLGELAERFDADPTAIREDLTTYWDLESWGWSFDIFRRSVIEFVQPEGDESEDQTEVDPSTIVRLVSHDPAGLGVEHLAAGDLAMIYTAGLAMLDVQQEDHDLAEGLAVIAETMYGEPTSAPRVADWNRFLAPLQEAQATRHRVRILYSRAWKAGVGDRVIEPLRLIQTHRGWVVDAGPVGPEGNLRTYLLTNIRDVRILDESFDSPLGVDLLLHRQRETTTVRLVLAQDARWAADMYAESVDVVTEDEEMFEADLELLPPAGRRVGLIMLASGEATRVIEPTSLLPEAVGVVDELLRHHTPEP
jgi:proteasome accessory factor C